MPLPGATARFVHNEVWSKLKTDDPGVQDAVYRLLRFRPDGYAFMPKFKSGAWDGYISLFKGSAGTFPGGLLGRVSARLTELDVDVDTEDRTQPPLEAPELAGGINLKELRPYQIEAADCALEAKRGVFEAATGTGKCLVPSTRVLTSDLRWVPVGNLVVGDVLVGFDENGGLYRPRRHQRSYVESTGRSSLPCYEIELETGEILTATGEHKWLISRDSSNNVRWATTEQLYWSYHHKVRRGPIQLPRYIDVWETDTSHNGGYIRGLLDGEGSIRRRPEYGGSFNGVSFSQKDEIVLQDAREAFLRAGFGFGERTASGGVQNMDVATREGIRLLGAIRPRRLLEKWLALKWPRVTNRELVNVVDVRPVGVQEVVTLTTSTKTFLAEGFGSHNTEIMAEMIRRTACRSLIIVASRDLAWQTIERFAGSEREVQTLEFPNAPGHGLYGIVGDDHETPGLVTAALYQTLVRRLMPVCLRCDSQGELEQRTCNVKKGGKRCGGDLDFTETEYVREWLASFDAIHLDECHRSAAKTWWPVVNSCPAYWRFGYSATPFKSDPITELKLVGATGEIMYSFPAREAIDQGYLTEPFVATVDPNFASMGDDEDTRYIDSYRDGIVEHVKRCRVIAEIAKGTSEGWNVPTLILVQWTEQGRNIKRALREIGVRAEFISGTAPTEKRRDVMHAMDDGRLNCVIATTIFDEGVNVPAIGALILAGGGKAKHKVVQRVGRGLRVVEGKEYLAVFDIWDTHGDKYLLKHARQRLRAVKDAGYAQETLTPTQVMARIKKGDIRRGLNG